MPLVILGMATLTSLSHILSYITFLFSEWCSEDRSFSLDEYMTLLSCSFSIGDCVRSLFKLCLVPKDDFRSP